MEAITVRPLTKPGVSANPRGGLTDSSRGIPAMILAYGTLMLFASFSWLPRVRANLWLSGSLWAAAASLFLLLLYLRHRVKKEGRVLTYEFAPRPVHYVQLMMHSCVYTYWGWYWREVYLYAPLILGQIVFAYALDMLLSWWRRGKWVAGLGPFPIVLSTNLFLWFKDDWFLLQFSMTAAALLGKEFVTWKRDGRRAHIFNPSASALFVFAVCLVVTHATTITRGQDIAFTLSYPPHIYLEIFLVGLVVQALFSVTLVTLSALAVLYGMNVAYTHFTGSYQFMDSNIPVLVFLGAHLLVTDPATSPRTNIGRIIFGGFYGAGVFAMRGVLVWLGVPVFYDKLLCVPALNLSVRMLDRFATNAASRSRGLRFDWKWSPRVWNFAHMGLWMVLFGVMMTTGFLTETRGDRDPEFLRRACLERHSEVCADWVAALRVRCEDKSASACLALGHVVGDGRIVPRDTLIATRSFRRACELGRSAGCAGAAGGGDGGGAPPGVSRR